MSVPPAPSLPPLHSRTSPADSPLPRINLRKRSVNVSERIDATGKDLHQQQKPLPNVTSAFLSGLFADVGAAVSSSTSTSSLNINLDASPPLLSQPPLSKRNRVSYHASPPPPPSGTHHALIRCGRSFVNMRDDFWTSAAGSPTGVTDLVVGDVMNHACPLLPDHLFRHLDRDGASAAATALSSFSSSFPDILLDSHHLDPLLLAFPALPATVSNSSCNSALTRNLSELPLSLSETQEDKEAAYGWFVVVDDDEDALDGAMGTTTSTVAAALSNPYTVHKKKDLDEEVEWARAADTVDDVLGDLF